ncbi:MAG: NADH-quinone oxidoreductase subunit L [Alphaproteobacteria bacterium]|nr:NADH-quinone oxidoreductase subunit L [Alphaproteobacteria bacterium]MCL2505051.1 NADH-quinone oxidoreductase subunit L [Alphaproteobacteria bacterium]
MNLSLDIAIIFLPLIGAVLAMLIGTKVFLPKFLKEKYQDGCDKAAQVAATGCMLIAAIFSIVLFRYVAVEGHEANTMLFEWIASGNLKADWGIKLDTLSALMLLVVSVVSCLIHLYSIGYMAEDKSKSRFMAYLSLFTFFMFVLVVAPNMLQMFFAWEGVGFASYILISFWYEKESANDAGIKAFLVNRVSDFAFLLGIFACFVLFNSLDYTTMFAKAAKASEVHWEILSVSVHAVSLICFLFFIGAMGKSAQLGLHTWLPDAMEGPTPVSALIHSATMVTAGVFMIVRLSPLFEHAPFVLSFITVTGVLTCLFAGLVAITQFDIKKVIAYSTISQLGFMFFAIGISAYSAAMFHLVTHAFFKSLLFLTAGAVIHSMHGEQDMRKMGGLKEYMPFSHYFTWIGSLALMGIGIIGVFGFSGFYSKELILESAIAKNTGMGTFVYYSGVIAAFLTALYASRMIFMTFFGDRKVLNRREEIHEAPAIMILAMLPLVIASVFLGWLAFDWFTGSKAVEFWKNSIFVSDHESSHAGLLYTILPITLVSSGVALAYIAYDIIKDIPQKISNKLGVVYRLIYDKFYFDEAYNMIFVRPFGAIARFMRTKIDDGFIDKFGVDGIARVSIMVTRKIVSVQTGYLYHYAFAMILGLALLVSWFWGWRLY